MKFSTITILISATLLTSFSHADVTYWRVDKGVDYLQTADNTQPTSPTNWYFYSDLGTDLPGDAANVVITGGNIAGSLAFDQDGNDWELYLEYATKTELDAVFPAGSSYSIILSGGSLGTVTQQFSMAADAYPPTPYLTGADLSAFLAFDVHEPMEVNWTELTGLASSVGFEISEGPLFSDGDDVLDYYPPGTPMSTLLPDHLLTAGSNYTGYLQFSYPTNSSGTGGFETEGTLAFNSEVVFPIFAVTAAMDYDDFNGGTNSAWIPFLFETGKAFTATNDVLEFTSGSGPDGDSVAWIYDTDALTYTQDWAVAVDIANLIDASSLTSGQEVYFSLVVASDGLDDLILIENFMEASYSELFTTVDVNGVEDVLNASLPVTNQQFALKISFDADTKRLTSAYSFGGDYTVLTNASAVGWGLSDSDTFLAALSCGTANLPISSGELYADNFRIYGEPAISNEVSLIELEYNRDYEFPDTPTEGRDNWYKFDIAASPRVESVSVLSPAGDIAEVLIDGTEGSTNYWYFETTEPITTPWNAVNDDDWIITVGYNDGTFQSTIIPFTQTNGAAIPVINKQPLFTSQGGLDGFVTNAAALDVTFNSADASANFMHIDEFPDNDDGEIRFYADALPDIIGVVPVIHGPLATTSDTIPVVQGTNWWLLTHGWGRSDYNDDGIGYIVVKQTESDFIFLITDDMDFDNMPDDWEIDFFGSTNAVNGGANDDFDEDGFSNLEEFIAGVNPTNSASFFAVENPGPSPEGFVINWKSEEGRKYGVYWAKTLTNAFDFVTPEYLPHPQNSYTDTVHTVEGCGFYYIDVQLED